MPDNRFVDRNGRLVDLPELLRIRGADEAIERVAETHQLGAPRSVPVEVADGWISIPFERGWIVAGHGKIRVIDRKHYTSWSMHRVLLGWPTADSGPEPQVLGVRSLRCEHGVVLDRADVGTHYIHGSLHTTWRDAGGPTGWGLPVTDPFEPLLRGGGYHQCFEEGKAVVDPAGIVDWRQPRFPLLVLGFALSLDVLADLAGAPADETPTDRDARRAAFRHDLEGQVRDAAQKLALAGTGAHVTVVAFDENGGARLALWMHPITQGHALTTARGLVTSVDGWRADLVGESLGDLIAMYLNAKRYKLVTDDGSADIRSVILTLNARDGGGARLGFEIDASYHGKPVDGDARIFVDDSLYYDAPSRRIASSRHIDASASSPWIYAVLGFGLPFPEASESADAIATFAANQIAIPNFLERLPFPIVRLLPGTNKKFSLMPSEISIAALPDYGPARLTFIERNLLAALEVRSPSVTIEQKGYRFTAMPNEFRDPQFRWSLSWFPNYHPTTQSILAPVTDRSHNLGITVDVTDADGGVAQATTTIPAAGPTGPTPHDPRPHPGPLQPR